MEITRQQHLMIYRGEVIDSMLINQTKRLHAKTWIQKFFAEFEGWYLAGELSRTNHEIRLMEESAI